MANGEDDIRLLHGDCLKLLAEMPSESVDAVVTDPPYGQSNEKYDRGVDPQAWAELHRVCKTNAPLLSFAGSPSYHRIASDIECAGWKVRQMWGWIYRDGLITSVWPKEGFDRLAPAFDPICYAVKGKVLLNLRREGKSWRKCQSRGSVKHRRFSERASVIAKKEAIGHYPRTLVATNDLAEFQYFQLSRTNPALRKEYVGHPNQKPLALMRWLIDKLPPGGLVLDPFTGSGTIGVACLQTGRRFVGMELQKDYYDIACRRIAEEREKLASAQEAVA